MYAIFFAGMIDDTAREFGVDWPHFIAQVISFCIVAFLLQRFAYKRVVDVLEQRRKRITDGLANAEKIKEELTRAETHRDEAMKQANAQANQFIEQARAAAAKLQEQESQKAIAAAEQIMAKARQAAAQDHARMLAELKREVGRLVVSATTSVTGKILTPEDHQRLAEETARTVSN